MDKRNLDRDDPLLKPLTIAQAMELTGRTRRTIDQWIKDGDLEVYTSPIPPRRVVVKKELLEVELRKHEAGKAGRPRKRPADDTPKEPDAG
jgi:predicted DNA-binding transcriptional regulator AlpA